MGLKLGKLPARHDPRTLAFEHYATSALKPPASDTDNLHRFKDWHFLGNDRAGDCVWAGAAHETMNWLSISGGNPATLFTDQAVLSDYAAVTGYDPATGANDNGTDVLTALNYRRRTGIVDGRHVRHKIAAFVALEPGNRQHIKEAIYVFDAVGIGFAFPDYAMGQFDRGKPWTVIPGAPAPTEGHYVNAVGFDRRYVYTVSWGRVQPMSWGFFQRYTDESYGIFSPEFLRAGRSPEGFDVNALQADLVAL